MEAAIASLGDSEQERIACLQRYQLPQVQTEGARQNDFADASALVEAGAAIEDLVQLAALCCDVPTAWLALVDEEHHHIAGSYGLSCCELRREPGLVEQVLQRRSLFWLADAGSDARFAQDSLVRQEPQVRFFAGIALLSPSQHVLGYLAVSAPVARSLQEKQARALHSLARQAVHVLEERRKSLALKRIKSREERFLQLISQDLKKPFSSILGFSAALQEIDGLSPFQLQQALARIHGAAQSAYAILSHLLLWSRYELGAISFSPRWIQFNDILDNVLPGFVPQAAHKGVEIQVQATQDASLYADWRMSLAVVGNVLDNAIKYSSAGARVEIQVRCDAQACLISVSDEGTGISPERMQQLFCLSSELCCEGTAGERGTGLGLLLSKDFMDWHGGRIWAESVPGQGSCFYLSFPTPQAN